MEWRFDLLEAAQRRKIKKLYEASRYRELVKFALTLAIVPKTGCPTCLTTLIIQKVGENIKSL